MQDDFEKKLKQEFNKLDVDYDGLERVLSKEMFEVYIGRIANEVVYVGQGKLDRHKHLNSGVSHVYEANMAHFTGKTVEVDLLLLPSKELAISKESELIQELQPRWNKIGNNSSGMRASLSLALRSHTHDGGKQSDDWILLNHARSNLHADNTMYIRSDCVPLSGRHLHMMSVRFGRRTTPHKIYESFIKTKDESGIIYTIKYRASFMSNLSIQIKHCITGVSRVKSGVASGN